MKKTLAICLIIFSLLIIGIVAGVYAYKADKTKDSNISQNKQLAEKEEYINKELEENLINTSSIEEKISPNCMIVKKQYFKGCDHILRDTKPIEEEYINYTKEQFEKEYKDWKIENFEPEQINLYQEQEGFCGQHYLIKENNGVVCIYSIDETGNLKLKQNTEIQTMYLPEEDLEKIKQGINVIGDTELYSTIEDFE